MVLCVNCWGINVSLLLISYLPASSFLISFFFPPFLASFSFFFFSLCFSGFFLSLFFNIGTAAGNPFFSLSHSHH